MAHDLIYTDYITSPAMGGIVVPTAMPGAVAGVTLTANKSYAFPFVLGRSHIVDSVDIVVRTGTGNAADPIEIAIYDNSADGQIVTTGAVTGKIDTSGAKTLSLVSPVSLVSNISYLAAIASPNTPTLSGLTFTSDDLIFISGRWPDVNTPASRGANNPAGTHTSAYPLGSFEDDVSNAAITEMPLMVFYSSV